VFASLVLLLPFQAVRARQAVAETTNVLAPIADVLSASSWLLANGLDPRFPASNLNWAAIPKPQSLESDATPDAPSTQIVTRQSGAFPVTSQPSLAVDPLDPNHLVLGVSALDLPSVATYVSRDGGATWTGPYQAPYFQHDSTGLGGPTVAFDRAGNVFLASLSVGFEELPVGASRVSTVRTRIIVSKSVDGGVSWGDPVSAAVAPVETALASDEVGAVRGEVTTRFLDKPSIVIGSDPRRPDRDVIYVAYTEFSTRFSATDAPGAMVLSFPRVSSTIQVIRSADGGQTWSNPVPASPTVTRSTGNSSQINGPVSTPGAAPPAQEPLPPAGGSSTADGDQVVQGARPALLSDGALLIAYLDSTRDGPQTGLARVMVTLSEDGGSTFSEPVAAGVVREIGARPRTSLFRWWGSAFPQIAIGQGDEISIAVTARPGDRPADDGDVLLLRSLDKGSTWESPASISADSSNASQFFPALAVQPDGTLTAIWADMRDDPSQVSYHIYTSESQDQGATWSLRSDSGQEASDLRVSDVMSNSLIGFPAGQFLGDQVAIAVTEDGVFFTWPDTRLAGPDGPNQQVAFARR
jgi:hypothetical protein